MLSYESLQKQDPHQHIYFVFDIFLKVYILLYNYINDIIILQIFVWASEVKPLKFQLKYDKNGLSGGF